MAGDIGDVLDDEEIGDDGNVVKREPQLDDDDELFELKVNGELLLRCQDYQQHAIANQTQV